MLPNELAEAVALGSYTVLVAVPRPVAHVTAEI